MTDLARSLMVLILYCKPKRSDEIKLREETKSGKKDKNMMNFNFDIFFKPVCQPHIFVCMSNWNSSLHKSFQTFNESNIFFEKNIL